MSKAPARLDRALLLQMIRVLYEQGLEQEFHSTSLCREIERRGWYDWSGAQTPERTVNERCSSQGSYFCRVAPDTYIVEPAIRDKIKQIVERHNKEVGYDPFPNRRPYIAANVALGDSEDSFVPSDSDRRASELHSIKARRGQQTFRESLMQRYGDRCMISGCSLMDVVEAAHIKPYRGQADNHPANGILLRADLHTLFDLDLIGIDPNSLKLRVHQDAARAGYGMFDGESLACSKAKPSEKALAFRWELFRNRTTR